ncbi:hypothetical protein WOLCODRAFT_135811 [Wolfiporia cocos MD-104 SS10]|uniref:Uncharacterized protein n=1 Tax=Wolfiporia cocos (strain MD-104) TaxID=742152 RepID=A0A2H3J726_WOLCO|nr:hypothetical protein WOLCODRAFT_135811 [Wolfiporia cocos MD-104 SS10]
MSLAQAMPQAVAGPSSLTATNAGSGASASPSAGTNTAQTQSGSPRDAQIFEFTRRKRWADLLVAELSEAILLVLSGSCAVWYCGAAVTDLLGWREEELVDRDLLELVNADDRAGFSALFRESVETNGSLLAYARLQCKNEVYAAADYAARPREVLFEITGHPHVLPETGKFQCFFAVAKPYPSRNTAMLNTFLELKMENERLQQRVNSLRAQANTDDAGYSASAPGNAAMQYGQANPSDRYYGKTIAHAPSANRMDGAFSEHSPESMPPREDDGSDASGSRKKVKRAFNVGEQYVCVTCGRTDSPEWRKGPLGPKTLCNACGLRWAKKVRTDKTGSLEDGGDPNATVVF